MLLRKSRADEEEEKKARAEGREYDALKTHRSILCDLAEKDGVPIVYVCEELQSGERLSQRPDFRDLLKYLRSLPKPGAILYVIHAERVTRGMLTERGVVQDLFVEKQILIRSPEGWTNLQSADERLLYEVRGSLAHHYLLRYKERVALTRTEQIRQGQARQANVPWGYEWDYKHKQPVPHPEKFPVLQAAAREALHTSLHVLSRRYGVPVVYLWRALRNPLICGWPAQIARIGPSGETIRLPREEWIWPEQEGTYPKACTRAEWERLQEALQARQRGQGGRSDTNHWCRDVVRLNGQFCRLSVSWWPIYLARDSRLYIKRSEVHEIVEARLEELFRTTDVAARVAALAKRKPEPPPDTSRLTELRGELMALERRAALLEGERLRAVESAARAVEKEIEGEKRRLMALRERAPLLSGEEAQSLQGVCGDLAEGFDYWWGIAFSDVQKRRLVRLLVEEVAVECVKVGGRWRRVTVVRLKDWLEAPAPPPSE